MSVTCFVCCQVRHAVLAFRRSLSTILEYCCRRETSFKCLMTYSWRCLFDLSDPVWLTGHGNLNHKPLPRSGELRTQKLKSHLVRTQSSNVLRLKPAVGQYIAIHATLTARNFFPTYFYLSSPFTCIFSRPLPMYFLYWLWLTPVPV